MRFQTESELELGLVKRGPNHNNTFDVVLDAGRRVSGAGERRATYNYIYRSERVTSKSADSKRLTDLHTQRSSINNQFDRLWISANSQKRVH